MGLSQLGVGVFLAHCLAGLGDLISAELLMMMVLVGIVLAFVRDWICDRFKFKCTATSCCRNTIVKKVIYLSVDMGLLVLCGGVVALMSLHF